MDNERLSYPDPVLRVKDTMDLHALAGGFGYVAFSLQTGEPCTLNTYPSRASARKFGERRTTDHLLILEVQPGGMTYRTAEAVLNYERTLISMGVRSPDSLETEENSGLLSMPLNRHDRRAMASQLKRGTPLYPSDVTYGNLPVFTKRSN